MDRAGNTHGPNDLLTDPDHRRNSGDPRFSLFDRSSPAPFLRLVQSCREGLFCRDRPWPADIGTSKTAGSGAGQSPLSIKRRQPSFPIRRRMKGNLSDKLRLINQARTSALRVCDPGKAVRTNNSNPTKALCHIRQPVQDRLANVGNPRADQEALADHRQAQGETIEAAIRVLLSPA